MLWLADLDDRLFGQRRRRAGLHAGAAGNAFGIDEMLVHARRDARTETAALDRQRKGSLHFLAGAHAAGADDALRRIVGEIGVRLVLRHPFEIDVAVVARLDVVVAFIAIAHIAQADGARHVLQLAIAVGSAGQTVERVIGNIEFHHPAADILETSGLRMDHHARRNRRRAGCRRSIAAFDLHETEPAGAKGIDHIGRTKLGHLNARLHRGAHDGGAFRHGDLAAIDGQRHGCFGFRSRSAVVDFVNERHGSFTPPLR